MKNLEGEKKMSYSVDLRKKVVKYVEENNNQLEASRVFDIGYETVRKWMRAYREENRAGCCSTPRTQRTLSPRTL